MFALAGLCARALAAPPSPSLPSPLTLETALHIFREHGLDLLIADAAVSGAEGDLRAAGAIANPALGVGYARAFTYRPNSSDPSSNCAASDAHCTRQGIAANFSDQAALSDVVSGKRGLRTRVARFALAATRHNRTDVQRNLEFELKQQYIQAVLAHDQLDFAREVEDKAEQIFELNEVRYRTGAISETDVDKIEVAKLTAAQAVTVARESLELARLNLAFLLGVRGEVPNFEVAADLPSYSVPPRLTSATNRTLFAEALKWRPDLQALSRGRERAATAMELARRERVPDLAIALNYQQIGSGGVGTNAPLAPPTLTVGLSAPLPVFYQQQGEIRRAGADFAAQDAQLAKLEAQVLNDVTTAFASFAASKERLERMLGRLLDRAARARDLTAIQYTKGAASLLEYLDAQRTYIGVNQEYMQELAAYWTTVFQLEQAVGADLRH